MIRTIDKDLLSWKNDPARLPLLLRGARQVGKTFSIEQFGSKAFDSFVAVNFEFQPQLKACFQTLNPADIINKMQLLLNAPIIPGDTLLFLDEIQDCPQAILALRYFKEQMPQLHIIGAGSLLDFALKNEDLRVPVGRIQFMYMKPLSFTEFLTALGRADLNELLAHTNLAKPIDPSIHEHLLGILREYLIVGGMPAIVQEYITHKDLLRCQHAQANLWQTYQADFVKYGRRVPYEHLHKIFHSAPSLIGKRFKYVQVDPLVRSKDLKSALQFLILAGLIHPIYTSSASGLPLGAQINTQKFKLILIDVGLMQNACGLNAQTAFSQDILSINAGAVAEQFVGQELLAYQDSHLKPEIFFWCREQLNSTAEADYLISLDQHVFPIEVKSAKGGSLRSLRLFLKEKQTPFGIRIAQNPLGFHDQILDVPLYMIEHLNRLAAQTT